MNIQYKNTIPLTTKLSLKLNCMIKTHKSRFVCTLSGFVMALMMMPLSASAEVSANSPLQQSDEASVVTVQGTVVDATGLPLIGASVVEQGTLNGTITDVDGKFSLAVKKGATLEVSSIGFKTVFVTANGGVLDVTLVEDTELLNEVVVTALGIKREQKALSYNVQAVDGDKLTAVKDANFVNSLNGKVAGVVINSSSAGPGAASRVIMRGSKSLDKDNNALYVIDGIPMFNVSSGNQEGGIMNGQPGSDGVADLNPEDIESISVLTGPSAAALYGYQAANGVILVTTKKGQEGKTKVTFSNNTSFSNPLTKYAFQNTYGNLEGQHQSWGGKLATPTTFDPYDFYNTGVNVINGLTFSTGTAKNQTYASVSTTNTTGIIPNSEYNRYNFSFRNTAKFANDKLTLDLGAQYVIQNNKNMIGGGQYFNPLPSLYLFPRGENFQEVQMYERYNSTRMMMEQYWPTSKFSTAESMQNPYWIVNRMQTEMKKQRYMLNASLKWDITSWLNVIARVRVDNTAQDSYNKRYASTVTTFTEGSANGYYGHAKQNDYSTYADVIANISKTWDNWSLHVNVGGSIDDRSSNSAYFNGGLNKVANFFHYGNIKKDSSKRNETSWHQQIQSVFASGEVGWKRMVYLTVTARNDWDSALAFTKTPSFFYPSAGLSFVASELFDLPMALPYLKVRASWSEVGSAPSVGMTTETLKYNEQMDQYAYPTTKFNENLLPEKTRSWELGLNAKFVEGRINFDFTWYKSNTFNQTFYIPVSGTSAYSNYPIQAGNVQNSGVEIALGYSDSYANDKVHFSTGFTFTHNQNKIISLAEEAMKNGYLGKGTLGMDGGPQIRLTEGGTMGDLYTGYRLRQSPNGYIWQSATGEVQKEELKEYEYIGSTLPKFHAGWNTSLSYAGVTLNVQVTGRFGGLVVSDTQAMLDRYGVSQATAVARDNGGIPVQFGRNVDAQNYYETISQMAGTYYMYDATNIRLSELSISYDLPKKWFNNKMGLTVGFTGKNLWMIYCKAPFDPEAAASVSSNYYQGVDYFMTPSTRNLGFNVKLSF
ncbi:MAG: SusC/RagA family TonB-linked outer membrane protein [Bacteroidales bacterium]|nr:SusC/RagA family TonB-linked outer membrane protein [Bacteroidales bacterium]